MSSKNNKNTIQQVNNIIFDPLQGKTLFKPSKEREGFWIGAPSVMFDKLKRRLLLYGRLRTPKERGYRAFIAESKDGINFKELWSISKKELNAHSIEKAHLIKDKEKYRLYISYDPAHTQEFQNWQIDLLETEEIKTLDPSKRINVLKPKNEKIASVKDPYIFKTGSNYRMLVSYHPRDGSSSNTGLVTSKDGINFKWTNHIFPHDKSWNKGIGRITSIIYYNNIYYVFYDLEKSMKFSGEEKSGIAMSRNLRQFTYPRKLIFKSPYGTKSLRYIASLILDNKIYLFYEFSRPSKAHELRMNIIDVTTIKNISLENFGGYN